MKLVDPEGATVGQGSAAAAIARAAATDDSGAQVGPGPNRKVLRRDGGVLAVDTLGPAHGVPVVVLHGMPGSRSGPHLTEGSLWRRRARLIAYDRPGYGGSTVGGAGRLVADAVHDIATIADDLGLDRFAVVGRSAGAPHALAAAAAMPDRVSAVAVLVAFAPPQARELSWFAGMHEVNTRLFGLVEDPEGLRRGLRDIADEIRQDPRQFLTRLEPGLCRRDQRVLGDACVREKLTQMYRHALPVSGVPQGWVDDVTALRREWGFDPASIRVPTYLWHGTRDAFAPIDHTRWLASKIPGATLRTELEAGHFGAFEALPDALSWVVRRHLDDPQ